jgi:hypothetical protein
MRDHTKLRAFELADGLASLLVEDLALVADAPRVLGVGGVAGGDVEGQVTARVGVLAAVLDAAADGEARQDLEEVVEARLHGAPAALEQVVTLGGDEGGDVELGQLQAEDSGVPTPPLWPG